MVASISQPRAALQATRGESVSSARSASTAEQTVQDTELVRRFRAGDEEAFVAIVGRHRQRMFAVAFAMIRNAGDAEEIVQDTFIRAHRGLVDFRGDSSLVTWLHQITLNLARNRYGYFMRRRRHVTFSLDAEVSADIRSTFADIIASDAPSPAREATDGEFVELVCACMAKLGAKHREVLLRRNEQHQSYVDIAAALGISVGTVKSRIARARDSLRLLLGTAYSVVEEEAEPSYEWFEPSRPSGGLVSITN